MNSRLGQVAGIPISLATHEEVLADVRERIVAGRPGGVISITNTESMYHALRKPRHLAFIRQADHSLCDGVGVIVAGWFWGLAISRYNGPILQLDCSKRGLVEGRRHYFYGGKEGVADEMARRLSNLYPGLEVVGTY